MNLQRMISISVTHKLGRLPARYSDADGQPVKVNCAGRDGSGHCDVCIPPDLT